MKMCKETIERRQTPHFQTPVVYPTDRGYFTSTIEYMKVFQEQQSDYRAMSDVVRFVRMVFQKRISASHLQLWVPPSPPTHDSSLSRVIANLCVTRSFAFGGVSCTSFSSWPLPSLHSVHLRTLDILQLPQS